MAWERRGASGARPSPRVSVDASASVLWAAAAAGIAQRHETYQRRVGRGGFAEVVGVTSWTCGAIEERVFFLRHYPTLPTATGSVSAEGHGCAVLGAIWPGSVNGVGPRELLGVRCSREPNRRAPDGSGSQAGRVGILRSRERETTTKLPRTTLGTGLADEPASMSSTRSSGGLAEKTNQNFGTGCFRHKFPSF